MSDNEAITVQAAADMLGINKRTMYDLAAPAGPIPCYRIGRAVRFEKSDIENYKKSCRYTSIKQPIVGVTRLTASSPDGESELQSLFRKAGLVHKPKRSTRKKPSDSSRLQLVGKRTGRA